MHHGQLNSTGFIFLSQERNVTEQHYASEGDHMENDCLLHLFAPCCVWFKWGSIPNSFSREGIVNLISETNITDIPGDFLLIIKLKHLLSVELPQYNDTITPRMG